MSDLPELRGIVRGKLIELERDAGLPDGQAVSIVVRPLNEDLPFGDGLRRSFGAWSDDAEGLDEYLEWNRQQRKKSRARRES